MALVTSGLRLGGGVPSVVRWLRAGLESTGLYSVDVYDLATSVNDDLSRRLALPFTWGRSSLRVHSEIEGGVERWGANAVEIEVMRYRPRRELTEALRDYDLIQVVAGGAALGGVALRTGVPVALQVATRVTWERESRIAHRPGAVRAWRRGMTSWTTRIEDRTLRAVDGVLVENVAMLHYVRSLGQELVVQAPPGVDTQRFTPHPAGWQSDGYILSVCRLGDARKGLGRLVRAYCEMVRLDDGVPHLVLAGKGKLASEVTELITAGGVVSKVDIRPDVKPDELAGLYQGASVYVQASYEEGLGLSVLEAMAAGLPVVATLTAGSRESVDHGSTGWLVPQEPSAEVTGLLASRVKNILSGSGEAMSSRARHRCVAEFSSEISLARFVHLYETLLGSRKAPRL